MKDIVMEAPDQVSSITKQDMAHLYSHINKVISLPDYLESIGCDIKWSRNETSGVMLCPLPAHKDSAPSFRVNLMDSDVWVFHCFGCGKSGPFVRFWQEYNGIYDRLDAIKQICKKYDIKNTEDLVIKSILSTTKRMDIQRKLENENLVISNLGRMFLKKRKGNKEVTLDYYKRMNEALRDCDEDLMTRISSEISSKLRE